MKATFIKISIITSFVLLFLSCSIDGYEESTTELTAEESLIAGQIIGESVSENQNGLLSNFSEAFAIPTESNLVAGPTPLSTQSFRNLENYTYDFNSDTGVHSAVFSREVADELFTSSTSYTLNYTFYDRNQNIIENPNEQQHEIEAVEFSATLSGEIQADTKDSFFTRTDRLFMDGLSTDSDILTIDGYHSGEGVFTRISTDGTQVQREYRLDINYLNIQINKPIVISSRNFRNGVTGALSYESTIRQTANGNNPETKTVNGTIVLNGDGTALLKFRELLDTFRLRLANGEVFDEDDFEGQVSEVNLQEQIFTISNGQRILINDQTEIKKDDFNSLVEVATAVNQAVRVIAKGEYIQPDVNVNLWVAIRVEFELESNDFEDVIASVNLDQLSFSLLNGDEFFITESSEIDYNDDFDSFQDVATAVETGFPILAEGEFIVDFNTGKRFVEEVDFELDLSEFDEEVISVDLADNTFTIESGEVIKITDQTIIDEDGEYQSLEEVAEALSQAEEVEAKGEYYSDSNTGIRIAVFVEFDD